MNNKYFNTSNTSSYINYLITKKRFIENRKKFKSKLFVL